MSNLKLAPRFVESHRNRFLSLQTGEHLPDPSPDWENYASDILSSFLKGMEFREYVELVITKCSELLSGKFTPIRISNLLNLCMGYLDAKIREHHRLQIEKKHYWPLSKSETEQIQKKLSGRVKAFRTLRNSELISNFRIGRTTYLGAKREHLSSETMALIFPMLEAAILHSAYVEFGQCGRDIAKTMLTGERVRELWDPSGGKKRKRVSHRPADNRLNEIMIFMRECGITHNAIAEFMNLFLRRMKAKERFDQSSVRQRLRGYPEELRIYMLKTRLDQIVEEYGLCSKCRWYFEPTTGKLTRLACSKAHSKPKSLEYPHRSVESQAARNDARAYLRWLRSRAKK